MRAGRILAAREEHVHPRSHGEELIRRTSDLSTSEKQLLLIALLQEARQLRLQVDVVGVGVALGPADERRGRHVLLDTALPVETIFVSDASRWAALVTIL